MNTITKYDDLIRRLREAGGGPEGIKMAHDAADAIEQLSACMERWLDNCSRCKWKENET